MQYLLSMIPKLILIHELFETVVHYGYCPLKLVTRNTKVFFTSADRTIHFPLWYIFSHPLLPSIYKFHPLANCNIFFPFVFIIFSLFPGVHNVLVPFCNNENWANAIALVDCLILFTSFCATLVMKSERKHFDVDLINHKIMKTL